MIIDEVVQVSKESRELGHSVVKVVSSVRNALKDGFQPVGDLAAIGQAVYQDLVPGIQGVEKVADEQKESLKAFMQAWTQTGYELASEFGLK